MAFKENQRIEQIYFSNLKKTIDVLRRWKEGETDLKTADVLQAIIDADSAILMMYKNLGEAYAETVSMIEEEKAGLVSLQSELTDFKGEINAKIDEVNSYLLSLIRALEERVDELEGRVQNIEHTINATNRTKMVYIDSIEQDTFTIYDFNTDEELTYSDIDNMAGNGYDVILIDYTKQPMIYAELCQYGGDEILFERTYTIRANYHQLMTHCVQYRINSNDETEYVEDVYDVELPRRLMNLRAVKQANNNYNIFFDYDEQNPISVLSLVKMAANGDDLRVRVVLYSGREKILRVSDVTFNKQQTEIVSGSIIFSTIVYDNFDSGTIDCSSLYADTQSDYNFVYDQREIQEV